LGPDVNESVLKFGVNRKGEIRFGLGAIKGVGEGVVDGILTERKKGGPFKDIFDFVERLSCCNKTVLTSLALSGAFDNFNTPRETFAETNDKGDTFAETLIRYGQKFQIDKASTQNSLFGDTGDMVISRPAIPVCTPWSDLERLNKEKDLIGIYLSAHPLDTYRVILEHVCNTKAAELSDITILRDRELLLGGIVTEGKDRLTKNGKPFMIIRIEDFSGSGEIPLFGKDYVEYGKYGKPGMYLLVKASVQPRQWNENELELKVKSIQLLDEVKDKLIEKLNITLYLDGINDQTVSELTPLIKENPGPTRLSFKLIDVERQVTLNLASRTTRLQVTNQLLDYLEGANHIEFTINK
jgi:DNA polymerase-3 subunit alpha